MKNHKIYLLVIIFFIFLSIYTVDWISLTFINAATFGLFAIDKRAAIKHSFRVPEKWLLFYCLIGGWLGGLIAQQLFRHKIHKQPFKSLFFLTMLLNCVAVILYLSRGALFH